MAEAGGIGGCDGSVGGKSSSGVRIVGIRCKWAIDFKCCSSEFSTSLCTRFGVSVSEVAVMIYDDEQVMEIVVDSGSVSVVRPPWLGEDLAIDEKQKGDVCRCFEAADQTLREAEHSMVH